MKNFILGARIILGLMFFIFGLNNILHFLHMPMPAGDAGTYLTILSTHKIMTVVALLQIIAGILLLVGRFVPLALTIIAPIMVNILLYHLLLESSGIFPALLALVLELFLLFAYRLSFRGLFDAAPEVA